MKQNKAVGPDNLPLNLTRDSADVIAEHLAYVISLSLCSGLFPNDWKIARVIPLHKSSPSDRLENYHPNSALPIMSKVIEKVEHKGLVDYLEEHHMLADQQFGFCRKRSTELAVTLFTDDIRKYVDAKNLVRSVFIDFSKAFDTLSHSTLLSKLTAYGITDTEREWFTSYLFNRQQLIKYNSQVCQPCPVMCGVPRGSILGPLLFLIYANNIVDHIKHCKIIQYADDTVLYFAGKELKSIGKALSADMSTLASWFSENELILNLKKGKTEAMLFGMGKRLSMRPITLNIMYLDNAVNVTTTYKYLGVQLDQTLTLSDQSDM